MPNPSELERDAGWHDMATTPATGKTNAFCDACNGSGYVGTYREGRGDYCVFSRDQCPKGCKEPAK